MLSDLIKYGKFIGGGGSGGGVSSWNDLTDKPFYEETVTVCGDTLTWDGNTEGLVSFDLHNGGLLYKISSAVPTAEDFANGVLIKYSHYTEIYECSFDGGNLREVVAGFFMIDAGDAAMVIPESLAGTEVNGTTFPEAGTYLYVSDEYHVESLTIPGYTGFTTTTTEVKKLDNKYLDLDWIPSVTRTPKTVFDEDIKFGTSGMKMYEDNPPFELKKGQTYVVNWGGTEYICEVKTFTEYNEAIESDITYIWIGNLHISNEGNEEMEDSGEPFCYRGYTASGMEGYGYLYGWYKGSGATTISVRVDTEDIEVNKMPEMFLPDSVSGGEVCGVLITLIDSDSCLCNKTHAELLAAWGKKPVIASIFMNMGTESGYQYIDTGAMYDSEANVFAFVKNGATFVLLPDNTCIIERNEG